MKALISDIHGNFEALCAVMEDISGRSVDEIICLGDIVGYGPDPELCIDLIMEKAKTTFSGNHDWALINDPLGFNPLAADVIRKTKKMMEPEENMFSAVKSHLFKSKRPVKCPNEKGVPNCLVLEHSKPKRWDFIKGLREYDKGDGVLFVHASPLDHLTEYVFPDIVRDLWNPQRLTELFENFQRLCFCGHTHIPCAIDSDLNCIYPQKDYKPRNLDREKQYIINPGSVGQPRDHDSRASYLLFDQESNIVQWRRVKYDIEAVVRKSDKMCGKDNWCGKRLLSGR